MRLHERLFAGFPELREWVDYNTLPQRGITIKSRIIRFIFKQYFRDMDRQATIMALAFAQANFQFLRKHGRTYLAEVNNG